MFKHTKKLEKVLDIYPEAIDSNVPKVVCSGNDKVIIENYLGILEYDDCMVRLNTGIGDIFVYGNKLSISELISDEIIILGEIQSVEFER